MAGKITAEIQRHTDQDEDSGEQRIKMKSEPVHGWRKWHGGFIRQGQAMAEMIGQVSHRTGTERDGTTHGRLDALACSVGCRQTTWQMDSAVGMHG